MWSREGVTLKNKQRKHVNLHKQLFSLIAFFLKVGEEGVGIDAPESSENGIPLEILEGSVIADARPVGK